MKYFDSVRMPEVNIDGNYFEQGFDTFLYCPLKVLVHLAAQRCAGSSNLEAFPPHEVKYYTSVNALFLWDTIFCFFFGEKRSQHTQRAEGSTGLHLPPITGGARPMLWLMLCGVAISSALVFQPALQAR